MARVYNTETATLVATDESEVGPSDFGWYSDALYVTRASSFFTAGRGNAASKYSRRVGNMRGPGSRTRQLSTGDAAYWLLLRGYTDLFDKYFPDGLPDPWSHDICGDRAAESANYNERCLTERLPENFDLAAESWDLDTLARL